MLHASRDQRSVRDSGRTEDPPVALDFGGGTKRLRIIIGELDGWPTPNGGHFADQTDGIKSAAAAGIAAAEVVGEQSAPAGAEPNPAA